MTDHDDNPLAGIDLAAWQPPAPGDRLADAVVARMREPVPAVPAVETGGATSGRRWWLIAGIAAAIAAAAVFGMRGLVRAPRDGHGTVAATQPSHLDLGASSAELEAGAEVTWRRDGHRLVVSQPRGIATWRIADDDELVIDAGATVASVEAHGASLRVEVKMNLSDARVIGASAVTALVVSLVTVVVYEGRVKVTGQGQTVNVAPGNTVAIAPSTPPRNAVAGTPMPPPVDKPACDATALVQSGDQHLQQGLDAAALLDFEAAIACMPDGAPSRSSATAKAFMSACRSRNEPKAKVYYDELPADRREALSQICVRNGITFKVATKTVPKLPASLTSSDVAGELGSVMPSFEACGGGTFEGTVSVDFSVAPSGAVGKVVSTVDSPATACVVSLLRRQRFPATQRGGTFTYPFTFKKATKCDAQKLKASGESKLQQGLDAAALLDFEAALKCGGAGGDIYVKAFMAACRSRNEPKARMYYKSLPTDRRDSISQLCVRNGITF